MKRKNVGVSYVKANRKSFSPLVMNYSTQLSMEKSSDTKLLGEPKFM